MAFIPLMITGGAAALGLSAITGGGFGLSFIKDEFCHEQMLPGNVRKVTRIIETNKIARIFAGILTFGFSELMNHKKVSVEYFYEDEFIGSNEINSAGELYEKGKKFYEKGDYETAATYFARSCALTESSGNINERFKKSLETVRQKIKEEAARREREEAARREREEAARREREEAARREREEAARREREEAARREREEAARREREEAARREREETLRLERARTQSKSLLEKATNIYQQAEALSSLELKLEKYEMALYKCEESCAFGATEEAFKTLKKIFESCIKHNAHDEAEGAVQVVRKYFPSEAAHLQDVLVNQMSESWSLDYESRARRQQEQNNVVIMVK